MAKNDKNPDVVSTYPLDAHDRQLIQQTQQELAQFSAPVFVSHGNRHQRLYVAALDGTGNDRNNPGMGPKTNVALIYEQIEILKERGEKQIAGGYMPGPGTQAGTFASNRDLYSGGTYDQRLEEAYYKFILQAREWLKDDPKAQISVASLGFSRGAEQAAGLTRLIDERGIWNPEGMKVEREGGLVSKLEPTLPALVPPGKTAQALALFDPVGTGVPYERDRRPPPSVITGFQIKSEDDARDQFLATHILDRGRTHGDRFLRVLMPGAHSDVGGGYVQDGLPRINGNLMVDYLNGLSDKPFLAKQALLPEMERIHRSEEGRIFYSTEIMEKRIAKGFGESENRGFVESIGGDLKDKSPKAKDAEPRDESLNAGFPRQPVKIGPVPQRRQGKSAQLDGMDDDPGERVAETAERPDPLLDAIWAKLPPGISREKAEEVKLAAKMGGIERPDQFRDVHYREGDPHAYVQGRFEGFKARVDLSAPAPTSAATREREQTHDQEQAQLWERFEQQQARLNQDGSRLAMGGMRMRGPAGDPGYAAASGGDGGGGAGGGGGGDG